ncbi:hypothetical protein LINPERPRIM_LOCUS37450 [Linum perenne]
MAGNARQVNSQIESLSSHVERRLSQVFDVVNKNQTDFHEFRKILATPLVQSKALPSDGLGWMNNGVGNVSPHPASGRITDHGRTTSPLQWQVNRLSINMGMAKILPPHPTPMLSKFLP